MSQALPSPLTPPPHTHAPHTHTSHQIIKHTIHTDPEILERRYPVVLRAFKLRPGSGGDGQWRGGDGVIREV